MNTKLENFLQSLIHESPVKITPALRKLIKTTAQDLTVFSKPLMTEWVKEIINRSDLKNSDAHTKGVIFTRIFKESGLIMANNNKNYEIDGKRFTLTQIESKINNSKDTVNGLI